MVWCGYCAENRQSNNVDGKICCSFCGRVLDEDNFSSEPTFVKNAAGQSQLSGNFVRTVKSDYSASRERTLNEAYNDIESMAYALGIDGGDSIARPALAFYTIAVERNFTRGRRKEQVEAACLYIACRENKKPFLLIDFSEYLRINVYILGAVFLQLCKLLSLENHPIVQKPVDPSLFIHRFTDRLFGGRKPNISRTALHIVASMKRDWMQTGRKPSGVCGAALYISALSYGLSCSKSEIIKVVRICEATLTKRLIEFENTESGSLTIDEFNTRAEELEKEERLSVQLYSGSKGSGITEVLCEHKKSVELPFAHGLCESCYTDFVKLSGGLDGGSEPPAFQRAERERLMAKEAAEENAEDPNIPMSNQVENNGGEYLEAEKGGNTLSVNGSKYLQISGSEIIGALSGAKTDDNATPDTLHGLDGMGPDDHDESENFSDIDDAEVDGYLHNEEERHFKEIIWVKMNREYLEEQAAKQAAELAAKNDKEFNLANCSEDVQAAQELAAAAAAAVAKSRKEKQQKRAAELKNSGPAQTAAEATKQMLTRKRLSSKINYDVLEKLFDESAKLENTKKSRNVDDNMVKSSKIDPEVDDTYEEAFGEDVQYDEDVGGYDYDQRDDDDEY
ncbi:transcription factor IIIB 60 kDa subunit-like isoform X1 [Nicotiana tomentosiformis]|uniref:transcription factor IIIB 60 kDa subunit-like isoform X1 n=2 Tax=Nicotiana tomentosiformis TaxID=4098 RepID=UPI00051BE57A|nr:transcription factor IIIB 60 kDa subunit-like isoform X1 [Nicotiana tomentosiformis]XP_009601942.1 transcription factor IIIB 60 kDa subunit-like isoform X1 [Nicotiana tomentosiformis]